MSDYILKHGPAPGYPGELVVIVFQGNGDPFVSTHAVSRSLTREGDPTMVDLAVQKWVDEARRSYRDQTGNEPPVAEVYWREP